MKNTAPTSLLIVTQAVDEHDPVLGFFARWIKEFSGRFESVSVVCLSRGGAPSLEGLHNASVFSLGKESGGNRFLYALRFLRFVWREREKYDAVFVHMNPEYVILSGWLWRMLRKKIVFWYNHTLGNWRSRLAFCMAHAICHTSPYSFSANRSKSVRMPAGIDTALFRPISALRNSGRKGPDVLYVGRVTPIKGVTILLAAMRMLHSQGKKYRLDICGDTSGIFDRGYVEEVKKNVGASAGLMTLLETRPYSSLPSLYSSARICVNLTPAGNYDKTVLEAAASGCVPVVSSPAFKDALPENLFFKEQDAGSLAEAIDKTLLLKEAERRDITRNLRQYVVLNHSLEKLGEKVAGLIQSL